MTRTTIVTRSLVVLTLAALALGGCRSDGGVGRRDAQRSLRRTLDQVEDQYERDMDATRANFSDISDWFSGQISDPWRGMSRTVNLYLEGHAE